MITQRLALLVTVLRFIQFAYRARSNNSKLLTRAKNASNARFNRRGINSASLIGTATLKSILPYLAQVEIIHDISHIFRAIAIFSHPRTENVTIIDSYKRGDRMAHNAILVTIGLFSG